MARLRIWVFCLTAIAAYWCCAWKCFIRAWPIFIDDGGPMPSFYFGDGPIQAGLGEWHRVEGARIAILIPYFVAVSSITAVGFGINMWVVGIWRPSRVRLFAMPVATAMFLLLPLVGIGLWPGVRYGHSWANTRWLLLEVVLPLSLIGGLLTLARDRVERMSGMRFPGSCAIVLALVAALVISFNTHTLVEYLRPTTVMLMPLPKDCIPQTRLPRPT